MSDVSGAAEPTVKREMAIIMRITAFVFACLSAVSLFPPLLLGEELDFVPQVTYFNGSLEFDMQQRESKRTAVDRSTDVAYNATKELLRLDTDGYVYHPRFLLFHLGGAAGLIQSSSTGGGTSSRTANGFDEYNADAILLPEHPYNLELFTRRQNGAQIPFSAERSTISSQGALFRYKNLPASLSLSAISSSYERSSDWTDTTSYAARGTYAIGHLDNSAGYERSDSTSSSGVQATDTSSHVGNTLSLGVFTLGSFVVTGRQLQSSPVDALILRTEDSDWTERLTAQLPLNFSVSALHEYRKEENTAGQTSSSPETTTFNNTTSDSASVSHQLYSSLRTSYSVVRSSSHSTGGDIETSSQGLAVGYVKMIPAGSLNAGYSFQDVVYTRNGAASIVNEPHASVVPGIFPLSAQAIDQATIIVRVRNPNPPQQLETLTAGAANDYTVLQSGNTVQISVQNVPFSAPTPTYNFEFVVTYSLLSGTSEVDTRTNAFNIGFSLLDGLFNPFASYATSHQEVLSGTFPGDVSDTTTTTYGYTAQITHFLLYMERTEYRSKSDPYHSLRTYTDYRQTVAEDLELSARLSYNQTRHLGTDVSRGFSEKQTSLTVIAHKAFPYENLNLFVSGSYAVADVTGTSSEVYMLNPSVRWHVGRLDVSATVSRSYALTSGTNGKQTSEEDAYYLTVSRQIF